MKRFQVAVIGAGPAGSTASICLKKGGAQVALIDKARFPRDKVCGDGISLKTFRLLKEMGFTEQELFREGYRISEISVFSPDGSVLHSGNSAPGAKTETGCVPRKAFDHTLFLRAKETVDGLYEQHRLIGLKKQENGYILELQDIQNNQRVKIFAGLVIGADGATSRVAQKAGLNLGNLYHSFEGLRRYYTGDHFPNHVQIFYDQRILPGYVWVFPVSSTRANVGIITLRRKLRQDRRNLEQLFDMILATNSHIKTVLQSAKPEGSVRGAMLPLGSLSGPRSADHLMLVGDAAAFVHPITGGGIYFAIRSAQVASRIGLKAIQKGAEKKDDLMEYEKWYQGELGPGFAYARRFRRLFGNAALLNRFIALAGRFRPAAAFFMMIYGQPLPANAFLRPRIWLKLFLG